MANSTAINAIQELRQDDIVIAFMGPTGVGKSHFIDLLTNEEGCRSGDSLTSVTDQVRATRVRHPRTNIANIVLVDTPGFDDTVRPDSVIFGMISEWLVKTYKRGVKLSGLVYLHAINESRLTGNGYKNLTVFGSLCGDSAASRVVLVSTKWEIVVLANQREVAERREAQLKGQFWKTFIENGSHVERLERSDREEAWRIIDTLVQSHKEQQAVLLQEELVDLERKLNETEAGKTLYAILQQQLTNQNETLKLLLAHTKESEDPMLKRELEKECTKIRDQLRNTLTEAKKMKIPLGRRVQLFFFGKRSHAKAIKIRGTQTQGKK